LEIVVSVNGIHIRLTQEDDYMATEVVEEKNIGYLLKAIDNLIKFPKTRMWLDHDVEADVLYIHFEENPGSNHSEMRDDGIILDYKDDSLVGLTILEASKRKKSRKVD